MKTKFLTTLAMGLVLGIAVMYFMAEPWPQVHAQAKAKSWEYKVDNFHSALSNKFEERLNKMAQDGWEYAGVLCSVASPGAGESLVAFKRQKN